MEKSYQFLIDKAKESKVFNKNEKPNYYFYSLNNQDFKMKDDSVPFEAYYINVFVLKNDKFKVELLVNQIKVYENEVSGYSLATQLVDHIIEDVARQIYEKKTYRFVKFKLGGNTPAGFNYTIGGL